MRAGRAVLPPGVLGAATLLWGWQCQLLAFAVPIAVLLEAARWTPWRWQLENRDFHRIADVSGVALLVIVAFQFDAHGVGGIYGILRWLPFVIAGLTAAQLYSSANAVPYTALFLSVRRAAARGRIVPRGGIDMRAPCLVGCLVAATAGDLRSPAAFWASCAVVALALWPQRSSRYRLAAWVLALVLAIGLGVLGQRTVIGARRALEPIMMSWFHDFLMARKDPYRAYTAMGRIGRLKLSDRIVLRVVPDARPGVPPLLRTATYRRFARNMWIAQAREFDPVPSDLEGTRWPLGDPGAEAGAARSLRISTYMRFGKGLLPTPAGTIALEELPVDQVFRNDLGTLKVLRGPGHIEYVTRYVDGRSFESGPGPSDLAVPVADEVLMARIVDELGLRGREPGAVLEGLQRYFADGFRYSVTLRRPTRLPEPLHDFLLETRTGHCEFYASATVLLLRAAGVPARYASGYAVQEWSELDDAYIVRARHAHSWASAWIDGAWRDVDTTPAVWAELEAESAPWWEQAYDLGSWLRYHFARWRWSAGESDWTTWGLWLLLPLTLILVWRLGLGARVRTAGGRARHAPVERPGLDSELYAVEREIAERGHPRAPGESLRDWLHRLEREGVVPGAGELARELLPLHYRYRFDSRGLAPGERVRLREGAARWLAHAPPPS